MLLSKSSFASILSHMVMHCVQHNFRDSPKLDCAVTGFPGVLEHSRLFFHARELGVYIILSKRSFLSTISKTLLSILSYPLTL